MFRSTVPATERYGLKEQARQRKTCALKFPVAAQVREKAADSRRHLPFCSQWGNPHDLTLRKSKVINTGNASWSTDSECENRRRKRPGVLRRNNKIRTSSPWQTN